VPRGWQVGSGQREVLVSGDPRLDRYRRAIAEVYDDFQLVGHVATRVVLVWSVRSSRWRRNPTHPVELLEWRMTPVAPQTPWTTAPPGPARCRPLEEGVVFDTDRQLDEWDQGWWVWRGKMLRLTWLPATR